MHATTRIALFGLALAAFPCAADDKAADAELKKLEGTWKVVGLEVAGMKQPAEKRRFAVIDMTDHDKFDGALGHHIYPAERRRSNASSPS